MTFLWLVIPTCAGKTWLRPFRQDLSLCAHCLEKNSSEFVSRRVIDPTAFFLFIDQKLVLDLTVLVCLLKLKAGVHEQEGLV